MRQVFVVFSLSSQADFSPSDIVQNLHFSEPIAILMMTN